jgi:hypothetical protein
VLTPSSEPRRIELVVFFCFPLLQLEKENSAILVPGVLIFRSFLHFCFRNIHKTYEGMALIDFAPWTTRLVSITHVLNSISRLLGRNVIVSWRAEIHSSLCMLSDSVLKVVLIYSRGAQILAARSPWWLNFVQWRLICVGPTNGTCGMSPVWRLEFWGDS